jgi:ribosome maturation factor RimP
MSNFKLYYDLFRTNGNTKWLITLIDGWVREGTPWAGHIVNMEQPAFMFHDGHRNYKIPYDKIKTASKII